MRIRTSSTNESAGDHFWKTALITCESNYSAGLGCPGRLPIANTSQPVSNSDSSSRFEVGPAWTQRFRQIRWTIHTQFTECKQTDKVKDLHWLTSRKLLEEGGVQVRTQLAYLFPDNLHRSKNWRAPRLTSSELQVPPGDVSHKCANLKAGVYIISIVEFSAIYGMVAVKHTFGLQENGVQKCVLQLPSHTLILTLDTDLEKDTPIIPVFLCLWIQFPPPQNVFYKDHHKH